MHSVFGPVELERDYFYRPEEGTGRFPLDEALGLVESFSPALVRLGARAAARVGYQAASEDLAALAGISIEGRQIHRLVNQVGPNVVRALEQGPHQDPEAIPVMYVEVDATGVPMVAAELAGHKGKQEDGSSKTREVKLGCVFTQTKPDEETGLPLRDPDSTTYVGSFETAEEFGARQSGAGISGSPRTASAKRSRRLPRSAGSVDSTCGPAALPRWPIGGSLPPHASMGTICGPCGRARRSTPPLPPCGRDAGARRPGTSAPIAPAATAACTATRRDGGPARNAEEIAPAGGPRRRREDRL